MTEKSTSSGSSSGKSSRNPKSEIAGNTEDDGVSIAVHSTFTIEPFDRHKMKWSRWVERFEGALQLFGVREQTKLPMLLHYMGAETYDVVSDKLAPAKPKDQAYAAIVKILEEHFNPEPLEIVECVNFLFRRQCAEREDETINEFLVALRKLAMTCNFGDYLNNALRNQLVIGLKSDAIRARLLEVRGLTLEKARDIAVSMELSVKGGYEIRSLQCKSEVSLVEHQYAKSASARSRIAKPGTSTSDMKRNGCYRCGNAQHYADKCPYLNSFCRHCGRRGHLQKVCLQKNANKSDTNQLEESRRENAREDVQAEEICGVYSAADFRCKVGKFWLHLSIDGVKTEFEIDSGSPVSIISVHDQQQLFPTMRLQQPDLELVSYSGNAIELCGMSAVRVEYENKKHDLLLYIAKNRKHPLLGRSWMKVLKLKLEKFYDCVGAISETGHTSKNATDAVKVLITRAVEEEIKKLVEAGVLIKVNHSEWATPVVPVKKLNNKVRLCGDYKLSVNPSILVDDHPLPTVEELFANVAGGDKFSKIDLSQAYLQLEVEPKDQEILTLSTHLGLYQPTRMMYGISSAPAIWQRLIEEVLNGIEGVTVFIDDIRVTGPNDEMHLRRLEEVFRRLSEYNMRVNLEKCQFFANRIEYCGYMIDRDGIHKVQKKIDAVQNMPVPQNKDQVRSFVGLVNYYGRFFPHLSTTIYPLNCLLRNDVHFQWTKKCEEAFRKVKEEMQSDRFLVHYNPGLPLVLATDASPYGVGAVLSHIFPDGTERPIQYASQTLNETQRRYKQVDREAYAIVFGIRKFYQYLYGSKFVLITDNQPLKQIFSETKGLPTMSALRMQHYATFLQSFNYSIKFRPTKDHCNADAFSRLPVSTKAPDNVVEEVDLVEVDIIETLPLTVDDLCKATAKDGSVKVLIQGLKNGKIVEAKDRFGISQEEFNLQQGCIMRGIRVYIPSSLREQVLSELHSTHFGSTRLKTLARGYVWWERIDKDIEDMVRNCASCQLTRPDPVKAPLHCWEQPNQPFERVHVDFAGPFLGSYFIVFVDAFTKWPEVKILRDITTNTTIHACREFFATFGIPSVLVSDHGVQFKSADFQSFLKLNGIFHKMGAPYHPATNGQAERFIQTLKGKMKALNCDKSRMHTELCQILLSYRKTIHPATGKSPSMMVFNRQIRSRLDLMIPDPKAKTNDPEIKIRSIPEGARVAARDYLDRTKWKYGHVIEKLGKLHYNVQLDDNRTWKRHIDQLREVGANLGKPAQTSQEFPEHFDPIPTKTASERNDAVEEPRVELSTENLSTTASGDIQEPSNAVTMDSPAIDQPLLRRSTRIGQQLQRLNL
ncbi:uncharacterized protein K02A2.6-like [Uranotaenia lowii]|uniref:uncharacterized protein K02A2.6-like n=1 Tax=Uranotaenia lowii TaxID=190385 RepID=UPI0024789D11|nr:uncharacterized protein K02A2.6-like [Uranotaenia lowii]